MNHIFNLAVVNTLGRYIGRHKLILRFPSRASLHFNTIPDAHTKEYILDDIGEQVFVIDEYNQTCVFRGMFLDYPN